MSLLDINLDNRVKLKWLPDNQEAQLRCTYADIVPQRNNPTRNNLALTFDVVDDPAVDDIRVWIPIPTEDLKNEDPKRWEKGARRLEGCLEALGVSMPIDTSDLVGRECWALISEEEDQNGEIRNGIRRFIAAQFYNRPV